MRVIVRAVPPELPMPRLTPPISAVRQCPAAHTSSSGRLRSPVGPSAGAEQNDGSGTANAGCADLSCCDPSRQRSHF